MKYGGLKSILLDMDGYSDDEGSELDKARSTALLTTGLTARSPGSGETPSRRPRPTRFFAASVETEQSGISTMGGSAVFLARHFSVGRSTGKTRIPGSFSVNLMETAI